MTTITLRSGNVLAFSKRRHGTVVLLNGRLWMGMGMFLIRLTERCAESGGSVADLMEQLGIEDDGTCDYCASGRPRTLCPSCGIIARCESCALSHDDSPLCRLTLEYADLHRQMRGGDTLEPIDRYAAIKAMAHVYLQRGQH